MYIAWWKWLGDCRQNEEDRRQTEGDQRQADGDLRQAEGDFRQIEGDRRQTEGIELVVDDFKKLGHDVVAMLPQFKSNPNQTDSRDTLLRMEKEKTVVFTPSRTVDGKHINCYDDRSVGALSQWR